MKKLLIFTLLVLPMTTFAASSVRVLGSGSNLPGAGSTTKATTSSAAKVTPSKVAMPKAASAAKTADTTSRIGTVRTQPKVATGIASKTAATTSKASNTTAAGARFPVITPAHSYNTVPKQQGAGSIVINPESLEDDPRVDMIEKLPAGTTPAQARAHFDEKWDGNSRYGDFVNGNYALMWIEE